MIPAIWPVINRAEFSVWPASVGPPGGVPYHHGHEGGLAQHTYEVLDLALTMARSGGITDLRALALGAVWHDAGKMYAYRRNAETGAFEKNRNHHLHHITLGLMHWGRWGMEQLVKCTSMCQTRDFDDIHYRVALMISSHHGTKEWGTMDAPVTQEAVILHHADMQSLLLRGGKNPYAR